MIFNNLLVYLIVTILLIILEITYFLIADRFNIIDKPNERSSHTQITLRGGGIVFYLGALIYFVTSNFSYPWFFLGVSLMAFISFLDDIFTISNRLRLTIHFIAVYLMSYQLGITELSWYLLLLSFIIIVGSINAYNFMDGINGITGCYSLAVGSLLLWENIRVSFIETDLLIYTLISVVVFLFFNFRHKAKCFAGDVGSVTIAYILLFALGLLIVKTGNIIYILFLTVYGIDSVWTILRRIYLRENIFKAHRSHLYQYLANEAGFNKLGISFTYGLIQFFVGYGVMLIARKDYTFQWIFAVSILTFGSILYLMLKTWVITRYVKER